jgi:hypothetical protein
MSEIAALRAEVEKLTTKVAALELRLPAPPKPVESELQIIGQTYENRPLRAKPGFIMPTDSELRKLCSLVRKRWPELNTLQGLIGPNDPIDAELADFKGDIRVGEYLRQMRLSFIALTYFKRTPAPDMRRYVTHWLEEAQIVLADMGKRGEDLRFAPFVCAAIMHGDIPYTPLSLDGEPLSLGLSKYEGIDAKDAWRRVVSHGVIDPVGSIDHASGRGRHDPSPVTIQYGD